MSDTEADATGANDLEERVRAIWSDILERQDVEIDAHLFDLGGDSLAATQIAFACQDRLSLSVSLTDVYANPTIEYFCKALRARQADS